MSAPYWAWAQGGNNNNDGGTNPAGQTNAITTAVPFLMISPDSRSGAMGDAGAAIADDANAMHWNPANLAFIRNRKMGFDLSYTPWLRALGIPDINLAYLPAYYNFGRQGGVAGLSMKFFSLGEIQFTDENGLETGVHTANEFSISGSYAHMITDKLSIGGSLRFIYSNLTGARNTGGISVSPGTSAAGDISFAFQDDFTIDSEQNDIPVNFRWGLNVRNIGAKMSYSQQTGEKDFLPTVIRTGYAFEFQLDEYNSFTFTNDFHKLMVPSDGGQADEALLSGMFSSFGDAEGGFEEEMQEIKVALGAAYWYNDIFGIRAGYFHENKNKGNRKYITLGGGLKFKIFSLDFAYLIPTASGGQGQNHPLQNTLRFTLGFDFNE